MRASRSMIIMSKSPVLNFCAMLHVINITVGY